LMGARQRKPSNLGRDARLYRKKLESAASRDAEAANSLRLKCLSPTNC